MLVCCHDRRPNFNKYRYPDSIVTVTISLFSKKNVGSDPFGFAIIQIHTSQQQPPSILGQINILISALARDTPSWSTLAVSLVTVHATLTFVPGSKIKHPFFTMYEECLLAGSTDRPSPGTSVSPVV